MYDNTGTICMISCEYIWHHIHSLWYQKTLWHSHTLYSCHHTQDTWHRIHCSWAITYCLLIIARLQYLWYQTTICMTSYEFDVTSQPLFLTSKDCIHDITYTLFLSTEPLHTCHTLHLWYHCHSTMTRPLLYFWHYTQCIWYFTWWMNENTITVSHMISNVSV